MYSSDEERVYEYSNLLYASVTASDFDYKFAQHTHSNYEIFLLDSGEVDYHVEGANYSLLKNDIIITNPKELHAPIVKKGSEYCRKYIQFDNRVLYALESSKLNLLSAFENRPLGILNKIDAKIAEKYGLLQCFKEIDEISLRNDEYMQLEFQLKVIQMVIKIDQIYKLELMENKKSDDGNKKVEEIIKFLNKNISEKITLDMVASKFFIDKNYLCRLFKKNIGITMYEYLSMKRIMLSKELILSGMPMLEVCYEVGFEDYSCFYKLFKKYENKSPRVFLKEHSEGEKDE